MFPERPDLKAHARTARQAGGECADGAAVLVPHRRAGAGAVHAGRRGRSRVFSAAPRSAACPCSSSGSAPTCSFATAAWAGVVIRLGKGFADVSVEPGHRVRAGAGAPDVKVARAAAEAGIAGLSFLRGIPGAIGGALRMNGGAYGGETKDVLVEAQGPHPHRRGGVLHQCARWASPIATRACRTT